MLLALTFVFPGLIGQPQAVELLQQAVARQRIAPAYLFVNSQGMGNALAAIATKGMVRTLGQPQTQQGH